MFNLQWGIASSPAADSRTLFQTVGSSIGDWLLKDLARRSAIASSGTEDSYFRDLLEEFGVSYRCGSSEPERIPQEGPVIVVANHPFGLAEGPILGDLLLRRRPDVKFLANSKLTSIPELRSYVIPVDPFGGSAATKGNWRAMRDSIKWVQEGHLLVVFPAGEVASFRLPDLTIAEPDWNSGLARLVRHSRATVIPAFFHGTNSAVFHAAGLLHPRLRTLLLSHEFHNKRGRTIQISIGAPIPSRRLDHLSDDSDLIKYLRHRTYLQERKQSVQRAPGEPRMQTQIAAPADVAKQRLEVAQLDGAHLLASASNFDVYIATAEQIPSILHEIGRLREVTFRQAGEGTGNALDLDLFDHHYQHLFMWNRDKEELVGAYRLARTDDVIARFGVQGLYSSTLFRLQPDFLETIQPALELGRSFVRKEYQRNYIPLLLLWKAIGSYVVANPGYKTLFGPVSISRDYTTLSRELIVAYARARCRNQRLAKNVLARQHFVNCSSHNKDISILGAMLPDLTELSSVVSELEPDGKGVPGLLHHYLNIGGEILEFSVDGSFSDVLDGLVVVDLTQTNRRILDRYLGQAGADEFLRHHETQVLRSR